ncbi:MAG TPA: AsmA family protein, partial [Prolixibacteraceae bacterium]|nr:AsmA family protein [Prolixibacteraceae bacterium]
MKKTGKVLLYTFITFIILLVFLIIVAVLAEKKIVKLAFNQLSKTINVPVQVDEFGFTLIHDFPYATIECKDLLVSSPQTNEVNEQDTLFFAERLFISVKSKPLLKSIFEIRKVEIANARFFYSVDAAGVSNFDFLTDTTQQNVIDTSDNAIFLDIKDLKLNNVVCYYTDLKQKASAKLILEEIDLTGLIDNEHYTGEAKGKAILSDVKLDSTNLYRMEKTILNIKMAFEDELLSFENSEIQIDEDAYFTLNGSVNLGDSLSTEMLVKGEKLNLGNLSKYIPEKYMQEHGVQNFSGMLTAEASISGLIADSLMPAINADFDLQDGILHYQDYPELSHISLNGKATNGKKRNNATTSVDITSLKFQTINSKVNLNGNIKNLDKPAYKLNSTIDLDLQEIEAFIPDSLLKSIEGKVKAVISTKGVLPDSISDEYINLVLANSKVSLQIQNVNAAIDSTLAGNRINAQIEYQPNEV